MLSEHLLYLLDIASNCRACCQLCEKPHHSLPSVRVIRIDEPSQLGALEGVRCILRPLLNQVLQQLQALPAGPAVTSQSSACMLACQHMTNMDQHAGAPLRHQKAWR